MNSNVLHRWLKEHRALALVQAPVSASPATDIAQTGGFVPLQLPAPTPSAPLEHKEITRVRHQIPFFGVVLFLLPKVTVGKLALA